MQLLVVDLLYSTLPLWSQQSVAVADTGHKIRYLCSWLSQALIKKKIRYWRVREWIARFLDEYLSLDPYEKIWMIQDGEVSDPLLDSERPYAMLPAFGADQDMRVRFRTAVLSPRLFSVARTAGRDSMMVYSDIKQHLTVDLSRYGSYFTVVVNW